MTNARKLANVRRQKRCRERQIAQFGIETVRLWDRTRAAIWRERNREKYREYERKRAIQRRISPEGLEKSRAANRMSARKRRIQVYGITYQQLREMLRAQDFKCAVCPTPIDESTRAIDHDHATGKIRGLLCGRCNRALGQAQDNPDILRALADYLERTN